MLVEYFSGSKCCCNILLNSFKLSLCVLFPFRIFYIKECLPDIFMNFLRYLYVGYLIDIEQFSVETLVDLMTLADRYEVGKEIFFVYFRWDC